MTTILIIEDDPNVRDNLLDRLEAEGFEVFGAENGGQGVERANEILPDLIICDVMMPVLDGFEVLQHLRQNEGTSTIPFIFLTAKSDRDDFRTGMNLGADDYLTKPFTKSELLHAVYTRLELRENLQSQMQTVLGDLRQNIMYALPHELRTPLTMILGFSELMMMDYASMEREQILDFATTINENGNRLQRMIENYLVYMQTVLIDSDPERRSGLRNHALENQTAIITVIAEDIASKYGRLDDLDLNIKNHVLPISQENFTKIVHELVDNAFKFSKAGTPVRISSGVKQDNYLIHVMDKGRGMRPDAIKQIGAYMQFERSFYEQQGTGLGLVIAKRLTELHRGKLAIRSNVDSGTMIEFRLPI